MFEHVLRVDDYYDGIREGIALFRGVPHHFRTLNWSEGEGDPQEERFELRPADVRQGSIVVARAEFRRSETAPDPQFPPMIPQEVQWTPVESVDHAS